MQDKIWHDFQNLPAEAQRQVAELIASLHQKYRRVSTRKRPLPDWESEPFIGLWRNREEMHDSTAWVRRTRRQEWGEPRE